jgi:hypothetical protein
MDLLSLVKARETAMAGVLAAKTEAERKAAMVTFEAAATALAQASAETPRPLTTLAAIEAASAAASDDDDDDDDDEEEDEEKKAKAEEERKAEEKRTEERKTKKAELRAKMKKAKTEEQKAKYRAAIKKMDDEEKKAQAAVSASQEIELLRAQVEALAESNAKTQAQSRTKEVHSMLLAASREGKLTPAMISEMREVGLDNPERLGKILAALPKQNAEMLPPDEAPDGISTHVRSEAGVIDLKTPQNDDQKRILASMSVGLSTAEKAQLEAAMKTASDNARNRAANGGIPRA